MTTKDIIELYELIVARLEGEMTAEQLARLNDKLKDKDQARLYVEFVSIFSELSCPGMSDVTLKQNAEDAVPELDNSDSYMRLLMTLAETEKNAPTIEIKQEEPERVLIQKVEHVKPVRTINKKSIYSAIVSIAAALILMAYVYTHPKNSGTYVGFLNGTFEAQWDNPDETVLEGGADLYSGPLRLFRGLAEIEFGNGAVVVIEGPAEFTLDNDRSMYLKSGKLTARVCERAKGFAVRTDWGTTVDLGTEFGVIVSQRDMETHVFKGTVEVFSQESPRSAMTKKTLTTGQAVMADARGQQDISVQEQLFTKQLPDYLYRKPIIVWNHSFEMDGNLEGSTLRIPTGWQATNPKRSGAEDQPKRGNLPQGGHDGKYVCYLNPPLADEPQIMSELYQDVNASYVNGEVYTLTVSVGLRLDHRIVYDRPETHWKVGLFDATTGKELSSTSGILKPDEAGYLTDQTLTFKAGPEVANHRIQIRLINLLMIKQTQPVFDNVRLIREMPR